jgi:hypothetical protein
MISQVWVVKHYRNNKVIWECKKKNSLANKGAEAMLELFYRNDTSYAPGQFYVRLCNYIPQVTDILTSIQGEPSTNGYSAQLLPTSTVGFPTKDIASDGNYRLTSATVTFTASGGNIGPIITAYLATSSDNSGKLIAFLPLALQRTIINGDSMTYSFQVEEGNA